MIKKMYDCKGIEIKKFDLLKIPVSSNNKKKKYIYKWVLLAPDHSGELAVHPLTRLDNKPGYLRDTNFFINCEIVQRAD